MMQFDLRVRSSDEWLLCAQYQNKNEEIYGLLIVLSSTHSGHLIVCLDLQLIQDLNMKRDLGFWMIQGPGWLLFMYLVYAQAIPAIDYELGVSMGTQESAEAITAVGVAFWYGFALGDLVVYTPLLALGLIGFGLSRDWGRIALASALGITVYWPIVCLAAVASARDAPGWILANETTYWFVLPTIAIWGGWGLLYLVQARRDPSQLPLAGQ